MPYCTVEEITQVIPQTDLIELTDDLNASVNYEVLNAAINFAETTINSYLRSRYTLPLSETPELIKVFAVDLTIYRLHSRRMMREMPESIVNSYKNVISELGKIQKGIISLGIDSDSQTPQITGNREFITDKSSETRIFTSELLDRY